MDTGREISVAFLDKGMELLTTLADIPQALLQLTGVANAGVHLLFACPPPGGVTAIGNGKGVGWCPHHTSHHKYNPF